MSSPFLPAAPLGKGRGKVILTSQAAPAEEMNVVREVQAVLERRGAVSHPPVSLAVSDAVALGIAVLFGGPSPSGRVMDRFTRTGSVDSDELIEAARVEQAYATPEGHAALYCLIGWARSRQQRTPQAAGAR